MTLLFRKKDPILKLFCSGSSFDFSSGFYHVWSFSVSPNGYFEAEARLRRVKAEGVGGRWSPWGGERRSRAGGVD